MITIEQESLRVEAELAGHCDHKQEESVRAPLREISSFSGEMKLILDFLFNFHKCDSKQCGICCGLKYSVVERLFVFSGFSSLVFHSRLFSLVLAESM